ncbi:MAG: glucosamine-6-phosphate deaminase [Clostridiales bacterium]|nr:glucosamine-6-phosphate deaminase [Clostridiales bacterium]MCI7704492.1 glucosamine-6-phosphate deaminase [Clostridiales bacterium]MDY3762618.1 glucosamine-6-phosphate deaminase [Candidatus Ventricola sp.]MDY4854442.1 glucosamine-6-phosphate deaminase [Candidatus Ventricola sp.]
MIIHVYRTPEEMGNEAARLIAEKLNAAIAQKGEARLLLSTGASQFEMMDALIHMPVDFAKVTMFHLDEYVALPVTHIASFRKYLQERFVDKVPLKEAVFVNGEGDVEANIAAITARIKEAPIDVGVIGIGENGHIAFNDPPADFDTEASYKVVNLDERCKRQQVGEGWFATVDDVPKQAISMTVKQIMACDSIVSVVPHAVKAEAVKNTLERDVTNLVPATIMKTHPDFNLFLDSESAAGFMKL